MSNRLTVETLLKVFQIQEEGGNVPAVLVTVDGTLETVAGPLKAGEAGDRLRELLRCKYFQMVPCREGALAGTDGQAGYELWCNEEGMYQDKLNDAAMVLVGNQVADGKLHGNVLVVKSGFVP